MGRQKEIGEFVCLVNWEHPIQYTILKDGHQASGSWGLQDVIMVSDAIRKIGGTVIISDTV